MQSKGIYLALKPIYNKWSNQLDSFRFYLLNNNDSHFDYHIEAIGEKLDYFSYEGSISSDDIVDFDILALTEFNTKVEVHLSINDEEEITLTIKAAKFKKVMVNIPILEVDGYLFPFKVIGSKAKQSETIEPIISPDELVKNIKEAWANQEVKSNIPKHSHARGEQVIGLHMEALDPSWSTKDPSTFLSTQLEAMESALDTAIANHYHSIILIHGIGDGVLKNAIFAKLKNYPHVRSFENRYDNRFGYGATEVIFK